MKFTLKDEIIVFDEVTLQQKLNTKLSKENIDLHVTATLLTGDSRKKLAGALYIQTVLLNEALELLKMSSDNFVEKVKELASYKILFDVTEPLRQSGLKVKKSLDDGRVAGAKANKEKAAANKEFIMQTNQDILNIPAYARNSIAMRAKKIKIICDSKNITLANGKSYAESTIAKYIQGT